MVCYNMGSQPINTASTQTQFKDRTMTIKFKQLKKDGYKVEAATGDLVTLSMMLGMPTVPVAAYSIEKDMGKTENHKSKLNKAYVWEDEKGNLAIQSYVGGCRNGVHMNTDDKNGRYQYLPKSVALNMLNRFFIGAEMCKGGLKYNREA